jgi:hypothetical protein
MKTRKSSRRFGAHALWVAAMFAGTIGAWAQEGAAEDQKIDAIKGSLTKSMAALRSYEWVETVTVKIDGDQKSRKQSRCYYGADGEEVKVPIDDGSAQKKKPRGIRGRIAKKKTGEMEEYVQQAMGLVKQYIPPDPKRLQTIKDGGGQKLEVLDGASHLRAGFSDYVKTGDLLSVDVDPNANTVLGISVATYMEDDPEDAVKLNVKFGTFEDGTSYPETIELIGQKKKLDVVIQNAGYRKAGS